MRRICFVVALLCGCVGSRAPSRAHDEHGNEAETEAAATPPFEVRGEAENLLLVWYDARGSHTAARRSDIPEANRAHVRVDSLSVPPDQRLDPAWVYVADLRGAGADGRYPVRKMRRDKLEATVFGSKQRNEHSNAQVVIYGASWCGACRSAARFFSQRGVAYVEKDIERDAAARAEMQRKTRAAGIQPRGIPVIDFRGRILQGFDVGTFERLIAEGT